MYTLDRFPTVYLRARLKLIEGRIDQLPVIHPGIHHGIPVIRQYMKVNGTVKQVQCRSDSKKGLSLQKLKESRDSLMKDAVILEGLLQGSSDASSIDISKVRTIYNRYMWENIRVRADLETKNKGYRYKDMIMDSRAEMIVAQTLDSLGLEYKYEPRIIIGNEVYYPDFIVYLPEFQRCFFIEFLGKLNDAKYISRNEFKMMDYLHSGMIVNQDILLFCGNEDSMVTAEDMIDDIVALIRKYCRMYKA